MIHNRTSKHKDPTTANNVLIAGLALQSVAFIIFLGLYLKFIVGLLGNDLIYKKLPFIHAPGAASILVLLRTIFRLAETGQGVFGYLSSHEALFGTLQFAPISVSVLLLSIWHPGRCLRKS